MVPSIPAKSAARLGTEFCLRDAASPAADKAKYRCAAVVMAVRVASSISLASWQFCAWARNGVEAKANVTAQKAKARTLRGVSFIVFPPLLSEGWRPRT